jgi:hypothetical protein
MTKKIITWFVYVIKERKKKWTQKYWMKETDFKRNYNSDTSKNYQKIKTKKDRDVTINWE